jgi:hypothetical protein
MIWIFRIALIFALSVISLHGQVVDSLIVDVKLFGLGGEGMSDILSVGEHGVILYGSEANPQNGISGVFTTKKFVIQHYDTSFRLTESSIELPFRILRSKPYVKDNHVYFLVFPQMTTGKKAALLNYDLIGKTTTSTILYGEWQIPNNIEFIVTESFLYITYQKEIPVTSSSPDFNRPNATGGYHQNVNVTGTYFTPFVGIYDLRGKKVTSLKNIPEKIPGYFLQNVSLISSRNVSDTVFIQFDYVTSKKKDDSVLKLCTKLAGYTNGNQIFNVVVDSSRFTFDNPYIAKCGERIGFFEFNRVDFESGVRYSYVASDKFYGSVPRQSAPDCYSVLSNCTMVHFNRYDSQSQVTDSTLHIRKYVNNNLVLDSVLSCFENGDVSAKPWANFILMHQYQDGSLCFVVSSWQILCSYDISPTNQISKRYDMHLPVHLKTGIQIVSDTLSPLERQMEVANRVDLNSTLMMQDGYRDFYYVYSLRTSADRKSLSLKLYKCRY